MEETQVIIVGCGPTGAMLSAYLGRLKVKNIVLEKEADITTDPRGIALDEDGIRAMQGLGAYDRLWKEIGMPMGVFNFVPPGKERTFDMHATPILRSEAGIIGPTCHPAMMAHRQPKLERAVRDAMAEQPSCELRSNCQVVAVSEDEDFVYVEYEDADGESKKLTARFLVGADGKTGFVRKKYLEPRGVQMEKVSEMLYEETWVAINLHLTLPTPATHPNFALFKEKSYSPQQVYDTFFPSDFRFFCNPERSAVCGRFGLNEDRLWRFEFVVEQTEDGKEMAKWENVWKVLGPYLKHAGSRHGLAEDVTYPEDCIELLRSSSFNFSARSCNKWALGRVILSGDSAHVFPPFGGQGIASGFRDATTLSWRLALAVREKPSPHQPLLEAWYHERKQQLDHSLALTIRNGSVCTERSPFKIFLRNWLLWFMNLLPLTRKMLEQKRRLTRYRWSSGMPFVPDLGGGICFPQVFCTQLGALKPTFTDDVIYAAKKTGLFQLVVLVDTLADHERALKELKSNQRSLSEELQLDEATHIVTQQGLNETEERDMDISKSNIVRVFSKEEFTPELLSDLPAPEGYDSKLLRKQIAGRYIILRPDRYIFAECAGIDELVEASRVLTAVVRGDESPRSKL